MSKYSIAIGITAALTAGGALAHPTDTWFETRGECEAVYAQSSKLDRQRLVDELGFFDTYGAAQRTFRDRFKCEYDEEEDAWHIVDYLTMP